MEKLEIEITADHIDWKEIIETINEAIKENTTDIDSVDISYESCCETEET